VRQEFIDRYRDRSPDWGFNGLGYVVYKRTYARPIPEENRSEEWHETIERVIDGAQAIGARLTEHEAEALFDHIWNLRASVSGRALWQLGTPNIERLGGDSLVNCWHLTIRTPDDFRFLFSELMLGGGVGFTIPDHIDLPEVRGGEVIYLEGAHDADFIVPDKREGWAELLARVLHAFFDGESFSYSTVLVRPEGAPINTFGGVASGPGILVAGVQDIIDVLSRRIGERLQPIDVLDIANIIGGIVVSGNVRRSAQIALHGPDPEYLEAKRWDLGNIPYWRAMSNNTVVADSIDELPDMFWDGYHGKGEPYGLFSPQASRQWGRFGEEKFDPTITGCNPCAEIPLGDKENCNLAEIFLPRIETRRQLEEISMLLYKIQKAVSALPYIHDETNYIVHRNMRLGLSVTGLAQATESQLGWLDGAYRTLELYDEVWSKTRGWPASIRLTTVKPSGTLSLLAGVTPGVHPGFSQYHLRRVRMAATDPLVNWCRERGYQTEFQRDFTGEEDPRTVIVEFPCEFPDNTLLARDVSAIDQLEFAARLQTEWADNAVSVTVYYEVEELPAIQEWLRDHEGEWKSVSFLLKTDHGFDQAPLEELSQEEYLVRVRELEHRHAHAHGISSVDLDDAACATGACPVR
jgi:ribonucleotide reductase alpha subunit